MYVQIERGLQHLKLRRRKETKLKVSLRLFSVFLVELKVLKARMAAVVLEHLLLLLLDAGREGAAVVPGWGIAGEVPVVVRPGRCGGAGGCLPPPGRTGRGQEVRRLLAGAVAR